MHWIHLTDDELLKQIVSKSQIRPQVIFKHSTRCSISSMALQRLQRVSQPSDIDFYFLDLLSNRNLSNKIAQVFKVPHESPQVLLIKDGECVYEESHMGISMNDIVEHAHAAWRSGYCSITEQVSTWCDVSIITYHSFDYPVSFPVLCVWLRINFQFRPSPITSFI